jgi:LysR family hca operon transcriptional activator
MLPSTVVVRPLHGEPPTIDLVMGYSRSNTSALLKRFVSRADELAASVSKKANQETLICRQDAPIPLL